MAEALDKETGEIVNIPDDELGEAFATGRYRLRAGTKIPVKTDSAVGVGMIDASLLAESGLKLASGEEVHAGRMKARHGTTAASQARALVEGGLRGVTLGGSDLAQTALGVDPEGIRERQEQNPVTAMGSEVLSGLLPMVVTGGSSAAVSGAAIAARGTSLAARTAGAIRTAGALPRAVGNAGLKVERAVAGAIGEGVLAKTVGMTAAGVVEGAAMGTGHAASVAALNEDVDLTAETLLAGAGEGALFGGGLGGALGAAAGTATKAGRAVADRLPSGLGLGLGDKLHGARARMFPKSVQAEGASEAARRAGIDADTFAATMKRERAKAGQQIEQDVNGNLSRGDKLMHQQSTARKADEWRQAILDSPPESTLDEIAQVAEQRLKFADAMADDVIENRIVADQVEVSAAKAFQKDMESRRVAVAKAVKAGDAGAIMAELDGIKRRIGGLARTPEGAPGQGLATRAQSEYLSLRDSLIDGRLWGARAVEMQVGENAAFSKMLTAQENPFVRRMFEASGLARSADGFQGQKIIKADKLKKLVESEVDDQGLAAAQKYFEGHAELQGELAKRAGATAAQKEAAAASAEAAHRIQKELNNLAGQNAFLRTLKEEAAAKGISSREAALLAGDETELGAVLSSGFSGTAMLGGVLDVIAPGMAVGIAAIPQAARLLKAASKSRDVRKFLNNAGRLAVEGAKAGKAAGRTVRRVAPMAAAMAGTRTERFDKALEKVTERRRQAMQDAERLAADTGELDRAVKGARVAAIGVQARATQFLTSKAPTAYRSSADMQAHLDDLDRVPDSEKARFLRYYEAVRDPMTVIERIGSGEATRQEMEALKVVYPRMFAELQAAAVEAVAEATERVPYSRLANLSLLLEVPLHPSFTGRFVRASQAVYAHGEEEPEEPGADAGQMASAENPLAPSSRKPLDSEGAQRTAAQGTEARSSAAS